MALFEIAMIVDDEFAITEFDSPEENTASVANVMCVVAFLVSISLLWSLIVGLIFRDSRPLFDGVEVVCNPRKVSAAILVRLVLICFFHFSVVLVTYIT